MNHNYPRFFEFFKNGLNNWHLHRAISGFAQNLISVFIPIYLLNLGFSLSSVLAYYFIYAIFYALLSPLNYFIKKIGFKAIIIIRPFFEIIHYLWIYLINYAPQTLYFLSAFNALATFYWASYDYLFSINSGKKNIAAAVGNMAVIPRIVNLFTPILGAIIITYFSFDILFLLVGILFIASIFPLLNIKEILIKPKANIKNFFNRDFLKFIPGFLSEGIYNSIVHVLMPLQIYLLFVTPLDLGIFSSIIMLSGIIVPLAIAYFCNKKFKKFIKVGAALQIILFLFAFFLKTQMHYMVFGFFSGIIFVIWHLPFHSQVYAYACKNKSFEFVIFKGIIINLSFALPFILMFLLGDLWIIYLIEILSKAMLFLI